MTTSRTTTRPRNHAEGVAYLLALRATDLAAAAMQADMAAHMTAAGDLAAADEYLAAARESMARVARIDAARIAR